jgi:hypothetical protein
MIDSTERTHAQSAIERSYLSSPLRTGPQSQSFADTLETELIGAAPTASSNAGNCAGQRSAARQDPAATIPSSSVANVVQPAPGANPAKAIQPVATGTTSASTATSNPVPTSEQAFDNAYWAEQPAAVQQLRYITNPAEKTEVATQLAQQGYSIDVPIMVWGWDPQYTTELRQSEGYTWVPSALQQPIELAPGLQQGAQPAYNPATPPPGSISV